MTTEIAVVAINKIGITDKSTKSLHNMCLTSYAVSAECYQYFTLYTLPVRIHFSFRTLEYTDKRSTTSDKKKYFPVTI